MHDCSNCGQACYCHGDIDDCAVETEEYAFMHCTGCGGCEDMMGDEYQHDPCKDDPDPAKPEQTAT